MNKSLSYYIAGFLSGCLIACLAFAYIARNQQANGGSNVRELKFAHVLPTNHPVHLGIVKMAERLEELSGGSIEVAIFPAGQLGDETKMIEQVQIGTLDMTKTSTAPMGNFVDVMKVFSLPYLFRDTDHYWNVLKGEIGQDMLDRLSMRDDGQPSGFKGLGYFDSGSRNFYATRPINSPADIEGLKLRVMRDPVAMDMVQALGGSPTPIPFGELYTALKQGVVDGAENNPPSMISSRHSEVTKYLTMDHHTRIPDLIVMSSQTWDSLNEQQQIWVKQAMDDARDYQIEVWAEATQEAMDQLIAEGVTIIEVDGGPFREAVAPVIEKYAQGEILEVYDAIQAAE